MPEATFRTDMEVGLVSVMGNDDSLLRAMLVSTGTDDTVDTMEEGAKKGRLNYLMKNHHGTPFEHASMTFYIAAPIFVFREFHRHRIGWSYNEVSGRYSELPPTFYLPGDDRKIKQVGKPGAYEYVEAEPDLISATRSVLAQSYKIAYDAYQLLLDHDVAKEVARMCLPVGLYTAMYATCNPRSLMAFLSLRTNHPEATFPSKPMREIEMVAEGMEAAFADFFPLTYQCYIDNGRVAP